MQKTSIRFVAFAALALALTACVSGPAKKDYSLFRAKNPRSILVVPAVNRSVNVQAPDYFLSTIAKPLAERGYYVFPVNMVRDVMNDDGLSDADMVHNAPAPRLARLFGADAVLYVSVDHWESKYLVLNTTTTVQFTYTLKDGEDGAVLWERKLRHAYSPQANSGGNPLATLVAQAVVSAIEKADPNYMPLTREANTLAFYAQGQGLPAGPFDKNYNKDQEKF